VPVIIFHTGGAAVNQIPARFGARSVVIQDISAKECRIEHAAPVAVGVELPLVFRCGGESFYIIARSETSRVTGVNGATRYESVLQFLGSTRELTALHGVLREPEAIAAG
jgi:hypothetical protein